MNRSWSSILLVVGLLGLLVLLATLQYRWLGQISAGEREHLQRRLEIDSHRFAEDFNREIQTAYFTFQFPAQIWREKDYAEFGNRYQIWREQTAFPSLIKDFYFVDRDKLERFDFKGKVFNSADWTDDLSALRNDIQNGKEPELIDEKNLVLVMPVYDNPDRLLMRRPIENIRIPLERGLEKIGYLLIKLDENTIKNQIFPALSEKFFSESEDADYNLAVVSRADETNLVFHSSEIKETGKTSADFSVPLFNLSTGNFAVFVNNELLSKIRTPKEPTQNLILNQQLERRGDVVPKPSEPTHKKETIFKLQTLESRNDKLPILRRDGMDENSGRWLLKIQHRDGSLENFITNTRRKNLAISFGVLSLLAASIGLIFLSSRRAQILAQRQLDFVSAVSHEFRTPLAVIYSAGENLTDGVICSEKQITQYGNLIKREGKKLSAMVEQILEFAGARSGRKKYDLRETDVKTVIEKALSECQSIVAEKQFNCEIEIAENLPKISADANALSHTIQNLIINAVKYGGESHWLKISAKNGDGQVKIAVEDKGIGISAKDLSNIFTPFYRAKPVVDAQIHGNGLGLSLVKQIVEAHGGKVFVESEIQKGSRFVVQLPVINNQLKKLN